MTWRFFLSLILNSVTAPVLFIVLSGDLRLPDDLEQWENILVVLAAFAAGCALGITLRLYYRSVRAITIITLGVVWLGGIVLFIVGIPFCFSIPMTALLITRMLEHPRWSYFFGLLILGEMVAFSLLVGLVQLNLGTLPALRELSMAEERALVPLVTAAGGALWAVVIHITVLVLARFQAAYPLPPAPSAGDAVRTGEWI